VNRLSFLKGIAGLPIVAALAPLVLNGQQEAQSVASVSTLTAYGSGTAMVGEMGQQIEQLPAGQFAQPVGPAIGAVPPYAEAIVRPGLVTFSEYAKDEAGEWAGYIEAADKSWISFINNNGASMAFRRLAEGGLEKIEPLVGHHLPADGIP
jgi:hypothetical protein